MAREFFCAYHSAIEAMEHLNDAERGRLFMACLQYSMSGEAPDLRGNERFVFSGMKAQIDRDIEKYDAECQKRSESGKTAALARWGQKNTKAYVECDSHESYAIDAEGEGKDKGEEKDKGKGEYEGERLC